MSRFGVLSSDTVDPITFRSTSRSSNDDGISGRSAFRLFRLLVVWPIIACVELTELDFRL